MEEMYKTFIPNLNEFSKMFKEIQSLHVKHIVDLSEQQKFIREDLKDLRKDLEIESKKQQLNDVNIEQTPKYIEIENKIQTSEKHIAAFRQIYQQYIKDTNTLLGRVSNHWGGYIEQVGVEFILNILRNDYGVHTWYQKYKKYWHKSKNVELDLVAFNDTHVYIIEVKNILKPEAIKQVLTSLDKIKEHVPELNHLIKQPVILCLHADEELLRMFTLANIWVMKYAGFEDENPGNDWIWLHRQEEEITE